jgi:PAS domain S-box-containing protein
MPQAEPPEPLAARGGRLGAFGRWLRSVGSEGRLQAEVARQAREIQALKARAEAAEHTARLTESLSGIGDSIQDVIMRIDAEGTILFVSPAARRLGLELAETVGRRVWTLTDEVLAHMPAESLARYRRGEPFPQGRRFETVIQGTDGAPLWLESVENAVYAEDGAFDGLVAVLRDVTDRRRLEDELRRKQAEAEAAMVVKSEFLANMSHEIRTPLTAVLGYAGMMAKMADLPEKARVYADRVARSGEALNVIVNNILDFSKVEAGQVVLRGGLCAIRDLVADATAQVREAADQKGLTLAVELESPLPEAVLIDRIRVNQVILNLLSNAIKFTPVGSVTLRLRHDAAAERLHVSVTDTGVGIPPDQADRLFQRFSQVEGSNTRRFGGVGLGLAISRGLVELMDGRIGFESAPGQGSTFRFDIAAPAVAAAATPDTVDAAAPVALRPLRILLADDVATNRELIAALLGPFAPEITEAANGAEAVDAAARDGFDIVLMDVQMPEMDGLAATRAIRQASPRNAGTPVIAISASVLPSDVEACREAGMNDHVAKPIDPRELLTKMANWTDPDDGTRTAAA